MNRETRVAVRLMLICVFVIIFTASGFAAEIRRVPGYDKVEQGLMALTLDVEGTENFRYIGLENNMHIYRGKIKPGSKLKFVIKATLCGIKTLPITGRSCTVRLEVIAKKGSEEIKKQSFKSDNKRNLFLNYSVPEGADTLEINETFVLNNKSKNREYNKQIVERNKLMLTTSDAGTAAAVSKTAATGDAKESKGISTGMLAGVAIAVAAIAGGGYFFMKKRKENQSANEEIARKEKLRYQEEQWKQTQSTQQHMPLQVQNTVQQQAGVTGMFGAAATMGNAAAAQPNFCSNCGTELEPGSRFCGNCGAKINN